jgi:hypothetical protein
MWPFTKTTTPSEFFSFYDDVENAWTIRKSDVEAFTHDASQKLTTLYSCGIDPIVLNDPDRKWYNFFKSAVRS